jgi:hypothetical protein
MPSPLARILIVTAAAAAVLGAMRPFLRHGRVGGMLALVVLLAINGAIAFAMVFRQLAREAGPKGKG